MGLTTLFIFFAGLTFFIKIGGILSAIKKGDFEKTKAEIFFLGLMVLTFVLVWILVRAID